MQYNKNSKRTELCRLDRKAQKSTYNCPKRYVNEVLKWRVVTSSPIMVRNATISVSVA